MAQHWYTLDGQPAYEMVGANGKLRDVTLRDARKFNYVPSVTTIIGQAAKPGLDNYLQQQLLEACLKNGTPLYDSDKESWKQMTIADSKKHSANAAKKGTEIHNALEQYYLGNKIPKNMKDLCTPVIELIEKEFNGVKWQSELSFAHESGFGGKIDLSSSNDKIILDFKTKDTDDISKMVSYDEHGMQTAAYAVGLNFTENYNNPKRYNLFISTKEPGLVNLVQHTDFIRDWGMFKSLLDYWQLKNKHFPGDKNE